MEEKDRDVVMKEESERCHVVGFEDGVRGWRVEDCGYL